MCEIWFIRDEPVVWKKWNSAQVRCFHGHLSSKRLSLRLVEWDMLTVLLIKYDSNRIDISDGNIEQYPFIIAWNWSALLLATRQSKPRVVEENWFNFIRRWECSTYEAAQEKRWESIIGCSSSVSSMFCNRQNTEPCQNDAAKKDSLAFLTVNGWTHQ
jgi:hypothetical protein